MPRLTLKQANRIVEEALAHAREAKVRPLAVVVLDESGHVKAAQRDDGASMFRYDVALGKAWAAVAMGASSRALANIASFSSCYRSSTSLGRFFHQGLYLWPENATVMCERRLQLIRIAFYHEV